jgi:nitrogen fixation protein FixH
MTMNTLTDSPARTGRNRRPKEVTGRMVLFWLVAFFTVVGGMNAAMVVAAVSTFSGLEQANPYQAGLAFSREVAAAKAQQARHWQVSAKLRSAPNGATAIELSGHDKANLPLTGLDARVSLLHPTNRRLDHRVAMQADGAGRFRGTATPTPGQWDLVIELSRHGKRLFRSQERVILR